MPLTCQALSVVLSVLSHESSSQPFEGGAIISWSTLLIFFLTPKTFCPGVQLINNVVVVSGEQQGTQPHAHHNLHLTDKETGCTPWLRSRRDEARPGSSQGEPPPGIWVPRQIIVVTMQTLFFSKSFFQRRSKQHEAGGVQSRQLSPRSGQQAITWRSRALANSCALTPPPLFIFLVLKSPQDSNV